MATTDSRTGFRLPWSSDRSNTDQAGSDAAENETPTPALDEAQASVEATSGGVEGHAATDHQPAEPTSNESQPRAEREETTMTELTATSEAGPVGASTSTGVGTPATAAAPTRRPSKFLADLTKAMQTAAEAAREESLGRLQGDAKAAIEEIHGRSSTDAAELRRRADDDVSQIREWSKQEIARIREETEQKVSDRKGQLEREIDDHAALIERHIDRIQSRVAAFEGEMAAFFERLLAEEDPTRFAEMAESLPEPPPFEEIDSWSAVEANASPASPVEVTVEVHEPVVESSVNGVAEGAHAETTSDETWSVSQTAGYDEAPSAATATTQEAATADVSVAEGGASVEDAQGVDETEAAMAAIQAAAEAAELAEAENEDGQAEGRAGDPESGTVDSEPVEETTADSYETATAEAEATPEASGDDDPRLAALGISADFAAAEAEAAEAAGTSDEAEEIPVIADEALAARLAGLVPGGSDAEPSTPSNTKVTQVVVVGLVSVASIASFKRHLGRLAGVQSVGVSSGPDGEFVFAVTHTPDVVLRETVPTLPGFQARVTGGTDDVVEVTARDPESEG